MGWTLDKNRPIYLQLVETLQSRIVSGAYPPGAKIDSVRDLAAEAAVNPNTMQRALAELEQSGLLRAERTAGRFVTEDKTLIADVRRQLARERVEAFARDMAVLGYRRSELPALLQESGAQAQ
ncbi:MAG: GntR family transcriptional regulator [Clostridiales bacterium]|nr:GntR family transcriptional regulator [Clostridiales bacterium]MDY4036446.1 GntR family transcriptional regulator [Candidatus Pseudoscilispira sp.]